MTWREELRQASFRGVVFHVESTEASGGRRVAMYEFPGRERPYTEDLGRRARSFSIAALVIGDGYMAAREALVEALEQPGPGLLVHPYYVNQRVLPHGFGGEMRVAARSYSCRESTSEGGLARFRIQFAETQELSPPEISEDTAARLSRAADALEQAATEGFVNTFNTDAHPAFVAEAAQEDSRSFLKRIQTGLGGLAAFAEASEAALDEALRATETGVRGVADPLATLVRFPANLAAGLLGGYNRIRALVNDPLRALALYEGLFERETDAQTETLNVQATPVREAIAGNQAALLRLGRSGAALGAGDALAAQDALLQAIHLLSAEASDVEYTALVALRAALVRDVSIRAAQLPRLTSHTLQRNLPALVLSYRLYGDADRSEEIVARNRIRHPGFVPSGEALEVLHA